MSELSDLVTAFGSVGGAPVADPSATVAQLRSGRRAAGGYQGASNGIPGAQQSAGTDTGSSPQGQPEGPDKGSEIARGGANQPGDESEIRFVTP